MKTLWKKIAIPLIIILFIVQILLIKDVRATTDTENTERKFSATNNDGVKLESDGIIKDSTKATVYLTVDSTGMTNGLAGYSTRIIINPCSLDNHGYIYGEESPSVRVLTSGWSISSDGTKFSGWDVYSYLDLLVEADESILNNIQKDSSVQIAIDFPVTTPTANSWPDDIPYSVVGIGAMKRTDCYNNVNIPEITDLRLKLTETTIPVTGVNLDESNITLVENQIKQLNATVEPINASNKELEWKSDNTNIATVDNNGLVKAISVGETTISVTTKDGAKTAICTVTVIPSQTEKWYIKFLDPLYVENEQNTKYVRNVYPETTINQLLQKIDTNRTIKLYTSQDVEITDKNTKVATGMKIKTFENNVLVDTYEIVVIGDLIGTGGMKPADLMKMTRYMAKLDINLIGPYLKAADLNNNNSYAEPADLMKMVRVLANLATL